MEIVVHCLKRFEVLTGVTMKITVFWHAKQCGKNLLVFLTWIKAVGFSEASNYTASYFRTWWSLSSLYPFSMHVVTFNFITNLMHLFN